MISTIVALAVVVLIVGLIFYLISLAPIDSRLKSAFYAVSIVIVLIYLLEKYVR